MSPTVDLLFNAEQSFVNASAVYAGLDMLARRGAIRLRFRPPTPDEAPLTADPLVVCLQIRARDGARPRLAAIDLHDQSHVFATSVLERCDGYSKRNLHRPDLRHLPDKLARKIVPFGLNHPCRTLGSMVRLVRAAGWRLAFRGGAGLRLLRHHYVLPTVEEFEQGPDVALEPTIVFQTRVWEEHETAPGETEMINEGRVAVIRGLREAFGERFRGGLVPTPLALARYPKEVSPLSSKRRRYTAMSKRNLIGVYTVGLHASIAFKLPEYLAASQCIVAEPLRNELPAPLKEGEHLLTFRTAAECVAACARLLADPDLAARMRRANHAYYAAEVAPAAHLWRVLAPHLDSAEAIYSSSSGSGSNSLPA